MLLFLAPSAASSDAANRKPKLVAISRSHLHSESTPVGCPLQNLRPSAMGRAAICAPRCAIQSWLSGLAGRRLGERRTCKTDLED